MMNKSPNIGKTASLLLLFVFVACQHNPNQVDSRQDPVREIINKMSLDSLVLSVQQLSGEVSVSIDGAHDKIDSRHKDYPGNDLAADYIAGKLRSYGLDVVNEYFSDTGRNVYAKQTGAAYTDQAYIICAHYDCMPDSAIARGADDNASGVAAVLEAARVLSDYTVDHSVVYAFWDEEEQGLRGSRSYARTARNTGSTIVGVINLDMIGWDSDNDGTAVIAENSEAATIELSDKTMEVNASYQIGLSIETTDQLGRSDHVSFWENGYSAIMIIEHFGTDFNQHYHTTEDRVSHFNYDYFHKCAKLAVATLAALTIPDQNGALETSIWAARKR